MITFRKLRADEIECRVARCFETANGVGCMCLLYKDARCDMNILDETVGPESWQRKHELVNGNLFCSVGIYTERVAYSEWVWKQDVGTESNTEKEKGQASDSFKRACVNWGIGRELYTAPDIVFWAGEFSVGKNKKPDDRFIVTDIKYEGNRIKSVTIMSAKTEKTKTFEANSRENVLRAMIKKAHFSEKSVLEHFGKNSLADLTPEEEGELLHKCKGASNGN